MAGDIYFNDVSLLLHCDGTNGGTTFTDSSSNSLTVTPNGDAQISTAQSKFGGASGVFDGTGDYLSIPSTTELNFGTGDFTIEAWVRLISQTNDYGSILSSNVGSFSSPSVFILCFGENAPLTNQRKKVAFGTFATNPIVLGTTLLNINQWYHIAVSRAGSTVRLFIDGIIENSATDTSSINFDSSGSRIGHNLWDGASGYFNGYIDDLRITKGVARYTSNFTAPTLAFPDYQPYVSGTITESLSATDFKARVYQLSDGALVGNTTVTSSPYTIELTTLDPVLVTMLPDYGTQWTASTAYALNDKVFPTDPAASPYYYECTTAGTSDASEPTWPTSGTVNDGTAVWTYVEQMVQPITHGPLIPS